MGVVSLVYYLHCGRFRCLRSLISEDCWDSWRYELTNKLSDSGRSATPSRNPKYDLSYIQLTHLSIRWLLYKIALSANTLNCFKSRLDKCWPADQDTVYDYRAELQGSRSEMTVHYCKFNPLEPRGNYSATSNNRKLVHWPLMGGLLHLVQRWGDWAGPQPTQQRPVYQSPYCSIMVRSSAVLIWALKV